MYFESDNSVGASSEVLQAMIDCNAGHAKPYGSDDWSSRAQARLSEVFEREVMAFFVGTGTANNALAVSSITPPGGAVFCHSEAHLMTSECGAPEFYTAGCKVVGLPGADGKLNAPVFRQALKRFPRGVVRQVSPASLSISQATEAGTVYSVSEIASLAEAAHEARLSVHMDGARFANALVALNTSPAEMTWKAGVDVLSFGTTKNGTMSCEVLIFFDEQHAEPILASRKRAGHAVAKSRFIGAQLEAYLHDGLWLETARRANRAAGQLSRYLARVPDVSIAYKTEANVVFALVPRRLDQSLRRAGIRYLEWDPASYPGEAMPDDMVLIRLICSFMTTDEEIAGFVGALESAD